MSIRRGEQLYVIGIKERCEKCEERDCYHLTFRTTRGDLDAYARLPRGARMGVVMLGDSNATVDGPNSLYADLAEDFHNRGIASLRIGYRKPEDCVQCGIDALLAVQYLDDEGIEDIALVGWSFGGAVALAAGSLAKTVRGIAALATSSLADCCISRVYCKPTLLVHGDSDNVNKPLISKQIYSSLPCSKRLIVYPNTGHSFLESLGKLRNDIITWTTDILSLKSNAA